MTAVQDEVHSESLTGASLSARASSLLPSLGPARERRGLTWGVSALACVAVAGTLAAVTRRTPEPSDTEAPRIEGRTISFSSGFAARSGIRTMEVREASFAPIILASGKAAFDPDHVATIDANTMGVVRRVVKYEGEHVKQGEVLAEIGSPLQARLEATASLLTLRIPSGTLGLSQLRAPLDGVVVERRISTGQSVRGERVAFVIANLDHLALELVVDPSQSRALKLGDRVELSREAAPASSATGVVEALEFRREAEATQVVVRVGVDNRLRNLRAGQPVKARIFASSGRALVIPNRAVAWIAGHPSVFLSDGRNSASAAAVTLGACDDQQTEVRLGLASGQRIVTDGVTNLKEASFL